MAGLPERRILLSGTAVGLPGSNGKGPLAEAIHRKCRVFVVDDERVIASTIAIILNQHGHEATDFFSAENALEAFGREVPNLLIADLMMPGMSGVDLAVAVRKAYPACRIMLFSGHVNATVLLEDAQRQGFIFPVHTKLISPPRLLELVDALERLDPA